MNRRTVSLLVSLIAFTSVIFAQNAIQGFVSGYKFFTFSVVDVPSAINSSGQIAGYESGGQAFLWTRAKGVEFIGTLGGTTSFGIAINDSGAIAGQSSLSGGGSHAFLWTQTTGMQDLGSPLGGISYASSVNANGAVAGLTYTPDESSAHPFFWSQGTGIVDTGALAGFSMCFPSALNNNGEIVGYCEGNGVLEAFQWTLSGGMQALSGFGGANTVASDINDAGKIVGYSTYADGTQHAALWNGGVAQDLGVLSGDTTSAAQFINTAGHVAGYSGSPVGHPHNHHFAARNFFWTSTSGLTDIGTGAGQHTYISGFNSRDQMVGHNTGQGSGVYLWSPSIGLHQVEAGTVSPIVGLATFNDAGLFLARFRGSVLVTPVMHVALVSSQNPSQSGQSVTFTATVTYIAGNAPDGEQVSFLNGSKVIGTGTLSGGVATFSTSSLKVGTHYITAKYPGDGNYLPAKSARLQQVVQ